MWRLKFVGDVEFMNFWSLVNFFIVLVFNFKMYLVCVGVLFSYFDLVGSVFFEMILRLYLKFFFCFEELIFKVS